MKRSERGPAAWSLRADWPSPWGVLLGFAYGAATADEGGLNWLERGLTVGLITGSAGAFWLGFQQRHP